MLDELVIEEVDPVEVETEELELELPVAVKDEVLPPVGPVTELDVVSRTDELEVPPVTGVVPAVELAVLTRTEDEVVPSSGTSGVVEATVVLVVEMEMKGAVEDRVESSTVEDDTISLLAEVEIEIKGAVLELIDTEDEDDGTSMLCDVDLETKGAVVESNTDEDELVAGALGTVGVVSGMSREVDGISTELEEFSSHADHVFLLVTMKGFASESTSVAARTAKV